MTMRLFLLQPTVVFQARVNLASPVFPLDQIPFDTVTTGAYTDIKVGQTVLLGSSAGASDLGRQRVRKTPTSSILYVGRSSQGVGDGELNVSDNQYITVIDLYMVWSKIGYIDPDTGEQFKDSDIDYVDQTSSPPPVSNCGPGTAATIDSGTGKITVQFVGTNSFAVANGASISTYLWSVGDGTITVGTSASSTITATFPAGFRWVSLTVTDSNGKTHISRCPVYARDPASDTTIPNWQMESHRITQQGQEISVKVLSSIPATTYPDGTLALVWENEPASASDRSHMLGIFWHHVDPAQIAAQRTGTLKDTTLTLLDVAGKLDTLPGFPLSVEYNASPDTWAEMSHANVDRLLHYILQWHSTALDLADWQNTGTGDTYPFVVLSSDGASLWDQVARRAKSLVPNYVLTANTLGQMFVKVDPMLVDVGSRTATVQATLATSDWSSLRFTHTRPARYHWLRANAIVASLTDIAAIFCISPGEAPAQGETAAEQGEQLAVSQSALNTQEGHRYARLNAPESHFAITLAAGSDQGIEPANMTWVRLTISSAVAAQRGLTFTTARGLVHSIDIRYQHERGGLVRTVELDWEREVTSGLAAVTEEQAEDQLPEPEFDPPPTIYDPTPPPAVTTESDLGLTTVYAMTGINLWRTTDFNVASPTWVDITPTVPGTKPLRDFILDPWAPATTGYLASTDGIYKSTDLDQATPSWSQVLSTGDITTATGLSLSSGWMKVIGSPNIEDFFVFIYPVDSSRRFYCARTSNGGSSWSHALIFNGSPTADNTGAGAVDMVPHLVSGAHILYLATDTGDDLYKSTDGGATWSNHANFPDDVSNPHVVHTPYAGNEDGQTVYVGFVEDGSGTPDGRLYKSTDGGSNFTTITPTANHDIGVRRHSIEASPQDADLLYCWQDSNSLFVSTDGGTTWTACALTGFTTTGQVVHASSGFPYATGRLYFLTTSNLYISTDGGATATSKKGSLTHTSSDFGTTDGFGSAVVVPLWVS